MWSVEFGRMSGRSIVAQETNRKLDNILVGINKAYQDVCNKDSYVTAEKVRNFYLGMGMNPKILLAVFRKNNEDYVKFVGKMKMPASLLEIQSYIQTCQQKFRQTADLNANAHHRLKRLPSVLCRSSRFAVVLQPHLQPIYNIHRKQRRDLAKVREDCLQHALAVKIQPTERHQQGMNRRLSERDSLTGLAVRPCPLQCHGATTWKS